MVCISVQNTRIESMSRSLRTAQASMEFALLRDCGACFVHILCLDVQLTMNQKRLNFSLYELCAHNSEIQAASLF